MTPILLILALLQLALLALIWRRLLVVAGALAVALDQLLGILQVHRNPTPEKEVTPWN